MATMPLLLGAGAQNLAGLRPSSSDPSYIASAGVQFADPAFQKLWARTDAPVSDGNVQRSWYWGPQPGDTRSEPYSGIPGNAHLVQYFDKGRMEVNNPNGDRTSEWFVTSGLLVAEMVAGKEEIGDRQYRRLQPAEIAVGGDGLSADPDAPTYTSFRPVASLTGPGSNRAPDRTGHSVTATINRAGTGNDNPALGLYPGAKLAAYDNIFGHNIPQVFWNFLNQKGVISENGALVDGQPLADWVFLMGYPITEPYWGRVMIGGIYSDVLFQMFERRTLAYIPSMAPGWQVQFGNVGADYRRWLYGGPLPSPVVPLSTPIPAEPVLPSAIDASVAPITATVGTQLIISMSGFRPGEDVVSWLTAPDGTATDTHISVQAALDGTVSGLPVPTTGLSPGQWAITFHGKAGNHESIGYFYLYAPDPNAPTATRAPIPSSTPPGAPGGSSPVPTSTRSSTPLPQGSVSPTPTQPIVPTEPPTGLVLSVQPAEGPPGGQFTFEARGLLPGEFLQVTFTDPNHNLLYPAGSNNGQYQADAAGHLSITLVPSRAFPAAPVGNWLFEVDGLQSNLQGVTGFVLR